jgi:hypothetical protein
VSLEAPRLIHDGDDEVLRGRAEWPGLIPSDRVEAPHLIHDDDDGPPLRWADPPGPAARPNALKDTYDYNVSYGIFKARLNKDFHVMASPPNPMGSPRPGGAPPQCLPFLRKPAPGGPVRDSSPSNCDSSPSLNVTVYPLSL